MFVHRLRLAVKVGAWFAQRQDQAERRSVSVHRYEIHRTIVPLHDLVSLRQADSAAALLGSEIQLEDFFLEFRPNAPTYVSNLSDGLVFLAVGRDRHGPTLRHGLHPVENDV